MSDLCYLRKPRFLTATGTILWLEINLVVMVREISTHYPALTFCTAIIQVIFSFCLVRLVDFFLPLIEDDGKSNKLHN